jgi:hypothetical protein
MKLEIKVCSIGDVRILIPNYKVASLCDFPLLGEGMQLV